MSLCLSANASIPLEAAKPRGGLLARLLRRVPVLPAPEASGELMPAPTRADVTRARQALADETNTLLL